MLQDDPQLTVRAVATTRQPRRVIVDRHGRTPASARILAGDGSVHLITESTDPRILAAAITRSGGESLTSPWSAP